MNAMLGLALSWSLVGAGDAGAVAAETLGTIITENIPEIAASLIGQLHSHQNVRSAYFLDWLPDSEGIIITTRFGNTAQLHAVKMPEGMRRQLTFFNDAVDDARRCPDFSQPYVLFTRDSAGNEQYQIYLFNYRDGTCVLMTDGRSKNGSVRWSNRGDRFAYQSNRRNGKDGDIYVSDRDGKARCVRVMEGSWSVSDWSPDDRELLVMKYVSAHESYLYRLEISRGRLTPVNPTHKKVAYGAACWSPQGGGIYYISDEFGEYDRLVYFDLARKRPTPLTAGIAWDAEDFALTDTGGNIALTVNEGGISRLYLLDLKSRVFKPVAMPDGQVLGIKFHRSGRRLALVLNTEREASDVYELDLAGDRLIRWTTSENAGLDTAAFVAAAPMRYETFDREGAAARLIPAFIYRPRHRPPPYPVLISCHGGPEGQARPYFSPINQFYLNALGIAVVMPNVRGSSGYGKTFLGLDNGRAREDAVKDIGSLLDWIARQPDLDPERVAIIGGSYGGYLALAAMARYSDRLRCGIDAWGISNFLTFLKTTAAYRRDLRRAEYGDERDPSMRDFLTSISPLTNATMIKKPLLVVQGANDPRVPKAEAEQIVRAVRANSVAVWYLLASDEGHGFSKKGNRDYYNRAVITFLKEFLIDE